MWDQPGKSLVVKSGLHGRAVLPTLCFEMSLFWKDQLQNNDKFHLKVLAGFAVICTVVSASMVTHILFII